MEQYRISILQVGCVTKRAVGGGLGISLEGTVDVEDGVEVRPHHYIRSILPQGPVGTTGSFWNGDQLLEVNGIDLTGMFHQEVVSTLKTVGLVVILVCSRRVSGPSPLHGTIVNNVETDCSKQAFNTRVSTRLSGLSGQISSSDFTENIVRQSSLPPPGQGARTGDAGHEGW